MPDTAVTAIATLVVALGAAVVAFLAMRSDRTADITTAAVALLDPLKDRIVALEAEMTGLHTQIAVLDSQVEELTKENTALRGQVTRLRNGNTTLRRYLERHGIPSPPDEDI